MYLLFLSLFLFSRKTIDFDFQNFLIPITPGCNLFKLFKIGLSETVSRTMIAIIIVNYAIIINYNVQNQKK